MALLLAAAACLPVEGDRILMRDMATAVAAFAGLDPMETIRFHAGAREHTPVFAGELERLAARKGIAAQIAPVCFERKLEALTKEQILAALQHGLPEKAQVELIEFSQRAVSERHAGVRPERIDAGARCRPVIRRSGEAWCGAAQSGDGVGGKLGWISRSSIVAAQDLPAVCIQALRFNGQRGWRAVRR